MAVPCVVWSWGGVASNLTSAPFFPRRLAELAPQYYLTNLPPSESRDLLMELREKLAGGAEGAAPPQGEEPPAAKAPAEDSEEDVCVLQ